MFTNLEIEIEKVIFIELIQKLDITWVNIVETQKQEESCKRVTRVLHIHETSSKKITSFDSICNMICISLTRLIFLQHLFNFISSSSF